MRVAHQDMDGWLMLDKAVAHQIAPEFTQAGSGIDDQAVFA